ncbi:MAG: hypothetical protein WD045_04285 [Pirellulaceae bacterium]
MPTSESNPFSTRFIRPGAIPYQFTAGESAAQLAQKLADQAWRGCILGPHGTGKSSLLLALEPEITRQGKRPHHVTLGASSSGPWWPSVPWSCDTLLIIDGYEQLSFFGRAMLRWRCWQSSTGLLVTSHKPVGLPLLTQTEATWVLAQELVTQLWDSPDELPWEAIESLWRQHPGDMREFLFGMYHLYQSQGVVGSGDLCSE